MIYESMMIKTSKLVCNNGQIEGVSKNPRIIKDIAYLTLKESIQNDNSHLFTNELKVFELNGKFVVISGNMRLRVCKELNIKEVPCKIIPSNWTVAQIQKEAIVSNVAAGEWDTEALANEWFDLPLAEWGLTAAAEWGAELETKLDVKEDDYKEPENIKVDVFLGDLIEIGEHRLLCGDSTCSDTVARLMNGEKSGLLLTDPPYNIKFNGRERKDGFRHKVIENDDLGVEEFEEFIKSFCSILNIINCNEVYVFCNWELSIQLSRYYNFKQCLCVIKNHIGMGRGYRKQTELCLYKGDFKSTTHSDILTFAKEMVYSDKYKVPIFSTLHPTQKPITLVSELINNSSQESNIVLDLFIGSGSTMVAAHQLKRKCYAMELDPKYCQVVIDRMMKLDPLLSVKINGVPYSSTN